MRNLPSEFQVDERKLKLTEIYEVELTNGSSFYYTAHDRDIKWGNKLYSALPIQRSAIEQKINLEAVTVTLTLSNITPEFAAEVQKNILDGAKVTIKRIVYDGDVGVGASLTLFVGTASVSYNRQTVALACTSILDSLNCVVPRNIYQEPCNNRLFDTPCTLTKSDFKYLGAATSDGDDDFTIIDTNLPAYKVAFDAGDETNPIEIGDTITGGTNGYTAVVIGISYVTASTGYIWYVELSNPLNFGDDEVLNSAGDTIIVNGTPAEDSSFFALGEIKITSGDNEGVRRMIRAASGNYIYVAVAFPYTVGSGETYDIYPGCDFRPETCRDKFDNKCNFNGYVYIPRPEEALYGET